MVDNRNFLTCFILYSVVSNYGLCDNSWNYNLKESSVDVEYRVKNIYNEYIVIFKNYYWSHTREKFINATLNRQNVIIQTFM